MDFSNPARTPLGINLLLFAIGAAVIWAAGTRLARYSKTLSDRTGAGQTFVGTLLLGGIVSLPEGAMAVSAAALGNGVLAVNTLLGGLTIVMAILAITDGVVGKEPLSSDVERPVVLLLGSLAAMLAAVAAAGITVGDTALFGAGAWTTTLFVLYVLCLMLVKRTQKNHQWVTEDRPRPEALPPPREETRSTSVVVVLTAFAAATILLAGFFLARTADALAVQTRLGHSFIGLVLGGLATSLPEVSSTIAAVRLKQHEMAFADAFGTNLFSVMLLFVVDLVFRGGPVLNGVGRFSLFAALLGIMTTILFVAGLIARPKLVILRMGIDSVLVLCLTALGTVLLYRLR